MGINGKKWEFPTGAPQILERVVIVCWSSGRFASADTLSSLVLMPTTYSRTMPSLPGTPKSHAERNAQAHVDEIVAAYGLATLAQQSTDVDRADLTVDMVSLIGELPWNAGDGAMALRDAIEQHCQDEPLSCEAFGRKGAWNEAWITTHYEFLLSTGGPACKLWCDPDDQEVRIYHQDWGTPWRELTLAENEIEALQWFVCILGIDA